MVKTNRKILVSACLAGIPCNYKGESKPNTKVVQLVSKGEAIPVCPECLGGLSIPRDAAERKGTQIITNTGNDITNEFEAGAQSVLKIAKENGCQMVIFKARSPSCGKGKIHDGTFSSTLVDGNGVTSELLIKNGIEVKTEEEI